MGVFSDDHLEGLTRLADEINSFDSVSIVQLHHAGMRSELIEKILFVLNNDEFSARALSLDEIKTLDFIARTVRSEKAGFHGGSCMVLMVIFVSF